jgi:hypothetical protein
MAYQEIAVDEEHLVLRLLSLNWMLTFEPFYWGA